MAEITKAEYLKALEHSGMTGHPGGIAGTRSLIKQLDITRGELVLDLGCGTGYTSCLIAREQGAEVMAADLQPGMLEWAKKRAKKEHAADAVHLVAADAHHLPFKDESFDAAVVESVLVFCDVPVALAEIFRVLKPGGRLGCNELTITGTAAREKLRQLTVAFGIAPGITTGGEWAGAFEDAGFVDVIADVKPIDWLDVSLLTPLRTDGIGRYLTALARSLTDPDIRKISRGKSAFIRSGLMRDLGSGLYRARRP